MKKQFLIVLALVAVVITTTMTAATLYKTTSNDKILSERGHRLVQRDLVSPVRKKLNIKVRGEMFSRCPSGLQYQIVANVNDNSAYFGGVLRNYVGCEGNKICRFRVNANEDRVEIFDETNQQFISAQAWLSKPVKEEKENNSEENSADIWNF
jgi:hypothetical protein